MTTVASFAPEDASPVGLWSTEIVLRPLLTPKTSPRFPDSLLTRATAASLDVNSMSRDSRASPPSSSNAKALKRLVPKDELGPLGEAKALLDWHARHRCCAQCGAPTKLGSAGWKRQCESCGAQHFPRTDPVVIMLAVRGDNCLLARQARFAPGMYSCIAGFVEPGETFEDAVRRETWEEAGLRTGTVRYVASQPWPFPGSLMIGCIAEALNDDIVLDGTELEAGRWFSRYRTFILLVLAYLVMRALFALWR